MVYIPLNFQFGWIPLNPRRWRHQRPWVTHHGKRRRRPVHDASCYFDDDPQSIGKNGWLRFIMLQYHVISSYIIWYHLISIHWWGLMCPFWGARNGLHDPSCRPRRSGSNGRGRLRDASRGHLDVVGMDVLWGFPSMGVPQNGWLIRENPNKIWMIWGMIWGVPPWLRTPPYGVLVCGRGWYMTWLTQSDTEAITIFVYIIIDFSDQLI